MYDPVLCMNVPDKLIKDKRTVDEASIEVIVSSYNSTAGKRYSLVTKKEHRPLHYAPSGWKTKEGAKKWAEKNGFKYVGYEENLDDGEKVKDAESEKLFDENTIDKAIRNCDATSISSAKSFLNGKIDNWYRNAKIDYGVSGKFIDVKEENGELVVYWDENGKRKKYSFGKYWDDFSVNQLYNVWMEQAD